MQNPWNHLKQEINKQVKKVTKANVISLIEEPNILGHGDLALPCFALSKKFAAPPQEIAEDLAGRLQIKEFIKIEAVGPYVNFYIDWDVFGNKVLKEIKKTYGKTDYGKKKKVMIEFGTANTNKALHIGHTRNLVIGDSLSSIMKAAGFGVIRVDYMGDIGLHVAKTIYAYDKWGKLKKPKGKPDHFVGELYTMFAKKMDKKPELENKAREVLKKWEEGDKKIMKTYNKLRDWALAGINETYKRFGIKPFDKVWFESDFSEEGKVFVEKMLKRKLAFRAEEGQIVADLENFGIPNFVMLRSDGTSLYQTKELALLDEKFKKHNLFKSINVVGREQELYFEQCYKTMELLKHKSAGKCYHLSYGLVMGAEGKMSGRKGDPVFLDNLIDDIKKIVLKKTKKYSKKKADEIAEKVAIGAIKYALIKMSPERNILFNRKEITKYEGDTGPYLQYTYARAGSILKKSKKKITKYDSRLLMDGREVALLKLLARYPEFVEKSSRELRPHYIASYIYMLCETFNNFYQNVPVLKANKDTQMARLKLVESVKTVLGNGLSLLGIPVLEEM